MKTVSLGGQRQLKLQFWINRLQDIEFVFTENGLEWDVSGKTWTFFVKKNPGDKKSVISLTLGNGISIPIYEDNTLLCTFTAAQTKIEEGEYYWELLRTDLLETKLNGWADFTYGPKDANP